MTHADAFLQDILAHPDDDAPRLIFADWLEEQGDANSTARAEFIRIQCALAGQLSEQQRTEFVRREQQIRREWEWEWASPLCTLVHETNFHRGFIDQVVMWTHKFLAHAGSLFRQAPIQHLTLRQTDEYPTSTHMAALAESEYLLWLRSLDLSGNELDSRAVRALVISKHLARLTSLDFMSNRIGDGGIRALARSPLLGRLERLNLRFNDIGANGLRALASGLDELERSPGGLCLKRLELSQNNLTAAGKLVIAESPLLRRLVFG